VSPAPAFPRSARPLGRALLAGALAALGLAAPGFAQTKAILGDDDGEFARRLYEAGYADLARMLCDLAVAPENLAGASSKERLDVESLRIQFELDAARNETDPRTRKAAIQAAIEKKLEFIDDNSRTDAAQVARATLPEDYRLLAEAITAILKEPDLDPDEAAGLRKEALERFEQAEAALEERIERFSEESRADGPQAEYAARQHELALFSLGRTRYFRSLLYTADDPGREEALELAIEAFEEVALEFSDSLNSYVGAIYEGLCYRDLGEIEDALDVLDAAIELRETYLLREDGLYDVPLEAADVVSQAVVQKMALLASEGRHDEAAAAGADFFATIPDPWAASHARVVAIQRAEALLAARRTAEALEVAAGVAKEAPDTYEARRANEILSTAAPGALGPEQLVRVAQDQIVRGELERALATCREALTFSRGKPGEADLGVSAYDLIGVVHLRQGRPLEALVAFDAAAELYPGAERAPESLYKAANLCFDLASKEKLAYFNRKGTEKIRQLATQYPQHPLAAKVAIAEGRALESDEKWREAAEIYRKVPAGSKVYEEARFRLGYCLYRSAAKLPANGGGGSGPKLAEVAGVLAEARKAAEARGAQTLDVAEQRELADIAFNALLLEIQVLTDDGRADEAEALLAAAEAQHGEDPSRVSRLWSMRLQALLNAGELDAAVERFEGFAVANPDDPATIAGAFQLAVALDEQAEELAASDVERAKGRRRQAVSYYLASVRPQLAGKARLEFDRLDDVAGRLVVLGLYLNGVPAYVDTFIDWESAEPPAEPKPWEAAAEICALELSQSPSQRRQILLGRAYGLLGRYAEAAGAYSRVFDSVTVIQRAPSGARIDPQIARNNPELVSAYLEYAVAEHRAGLAAGERNRLQRAAQVVGDLVQALKATGPDTRLFWQVKYAQMRSLADGGDYQTAKALVEDLERTTNDFDQGAFGYREKFLAAKAQLKGKAP
jgi:tetratricopeptide (TPR) repeat protein